MAKLMIVGWDGKSPKTARYLTVRGPVTRERFIFDEKLHYGVKDLARGKSGAVWELATNGPRLVLTWYKDQYGNVKFRNEAQYN